MKLKFFGGAQEVGRSAILLKDEQSLMFDYGMKVDATKPEYPVALPKVDGIAVSHAHLDHAGSVPMIYAHGNVPAFGTAPTLRLSELLLEDALKVAKKQHRAPKFHKSQIRAMRNNFMAMDYNQHQRLGSLELELHDAGHICGSAVTLVTRKHASALKRIAYTGDFKFSEQLLHSGAEPVECDVLITEGTYANRDHEDRDVMIKKFIERIKQVLDNGGTALVPVFAVGRSQELLAILYKYGLADRTYVDGMARSATSIVLSYSGFIRNSGLLSKAADAAIWIDEPAIRRSIMKEPSIILSTAGMLNGGPALDYITRINKQSEILLTGYQVEGTNGSTLIKNGIVTVDSQRIKIPNKVSFYDFSAHAGKTDLYEYVRKCNPSIVVCVHADQANAKLFAQTLNQAGYESYAPAIGETIDLSG